VAELPIETIVMTEGRRMMRLSRELAPEVFEALLEEYQRLLREVLERMGGRELEVDDDTCVAAFSSAKQAALAAIAVRREVAAHEWPHGRTVEMSIGIDSGEPEQAALRCAELCDAAEGGQIFLTEAVSRLLEREELEDLAVRDLGEVPLRRTDRRVRAYEFDNTSIFR
jgi:class 3 adenylate cyclase